MGTRFVVRVRLSVEVTLSCSGMKKSFLVAEESTIMGVIIILSLPGMRSAPRVAETSEVYEDDQNLFQAKNLKYVFKKSRISRDYYNRHGPQVDGYGQFPRREDNKK